MNHRVALAGAVLLVTVAVAGCTSGATGAGHGPGGSDAAPVTAATAPVTTASSTAVPSSAPASTSSSSPSSASPSSSSPTPVTVHAPQSVAPRSTCRSVTVRVIRGSADRGREFAALQFTNGGPARCTLFGYPTVTLRLGGRQVGSTSQPAGPATSRYVLAPGATAESRLDDYTACQAPLSDTIRVVVPGSTQSASRPGQLRACTLRVSALGKPE